MLSRWTSLLGLISLTAIGLLTYDVLSRELTVAALSGLSLVTISTLGYAFSISRMRTNAFRSAMSTYAERQMHHESAGPRSTFDAPSAAV